MLVVDASAAVKALTLEPGTAEARALIVEDREVLAPAIIMVEVASALSKKVRYHGLPIDAALAAIDALPEFVASYVADEDLILSALRLSIDLSHALQDCLYLALAIERGCSLLTSDMKFVRNAEAGGHGARLIVPGRS